MRKKYTEHEATNMPAVMTTRSNQNFLVATCALSVFNRVAPSWHKELLFSFRGFIFGWFC